MALEETLNKPHLCPELVSQRGDLLKDELLFKQGLLHGAITAHGVFIAQGAVKASGAITAMQVSLL